MVWRREEAAIFQNQQPTLMRVLNDGVTHIAEAVGFTLGLISFFTPAVGILLEQE